MPAPSRSGADLARLLMQKAAGDEITLRRLLEDDDIPDDVLGFHAQQAVEKMVKAVLSWHEVSYERTHNIAYLVTLLKDGEFPMPPNADKLPTLTPWAAEFRYVDLPDTGLDRREALSVVEQTKTWAEAQVVEVEPESEPELEP